MNNVAKTAEMELWRHGDDEDCEYVGIHSQFFHDQ